MLKEINHEYSLEWLVKDTEAWCAEIHGITKDWI